jgi:hypothetical protein
MNAKQRRVIEAARAREPRFLTIATEGKTRRFTAYDNAMARKSPKERAALEEKMRAADAEKDRLARAAALADAWFDAAKHQECPALSAEQQRLIKSWRGQ